MILSQEFIEGFFIFLAALPGVFVIGISSLRYYQAKFHLQDEELLAFTKTLRGPFKIYSIPSLVEYMTKYKDSLKMIRLEQTLATTLTYLGTVALILSIIKHEETRYAEGFWATVNTVCILLIWHFGHKMKQIVDSNTP